MALCTECVLHVLSFTLIRIHYYYSWGVILAYSLYVLSSLHLRRMYILHRQQKIKWNVGHDKNIHLNCKISWTFSFMPLFVLWIETVHWLTVYRIWSLLCQWSSDTFWNAIEWNMAVENVRHTKRSVCVCVCAWSCWPSAKLYWHCCFMYMCHALPPYSVCVYLHLNHFIFRRLSNLILMGVGNKEGC